MTIQQLEYFHVMASMLHYTNAAAVLHISQPGLSRAIREMEKEIGVPLFDTLGKRVVLTRYGQEFLPYASNMLEQMDAAKKMIAQMMSTEGAVISLGYLHSVGTDILPAMIEKFLSTEPQGAVSFKFFQGLNSENIAKLLAGTIDLAFTAESDQMGLCSVPAFSQQLNVTVGSGYHLAEKERITIEELKGEPMVVTKRGSSLRDITERLFADAGITPNIVFEADECSAMAVFAGANLGVAIMPKMNSATLQKLKVIELDVPSGQNMRTMYLTWPNNRTRTPAVEAFKRFVIREYEQGRM